MTFSCIRIHSSGLHISLFVDSKPALCDTGRLPGGATRTEPPTIAVPSPRSRASEQSHDGIYFSLRQLVIYQSPTCV